MTVQVSSAQSASPDTAVFEGRHKRVTRMYSTLGELSPAYCSMFESAGAKSFFQSLAWYRNLVATALEEDEQVHVLGVELEDGTPVAALPLRHPRNPRRGWKLRTLSSLSNYYTTLYAPVLDPRYSVADSLDELTRAIYAHRPAWDIVSLKPLDHDSPIFETLAQSLDRAGMVVQTYFCHGNWYCPINGKSYKEYLESLRSSVRNIARSKNKKLERSGRARIEVTTGHGGLDAAILAYQKVYAASWKVQEPFPLFVAGLIRTCAEMGWLRLGIAYIDDEPAAVQLWILNNGTASIYKIAYDQKFKDLSVGSYLTMHMMERAIDLDKVREIDYLSGDDRYKSDWMSNRREQWGILAMNPRTMPGTLAIVRHVGGRWLKRSARKIVKRTPNMTEATSSK
ncbi:MAG TPA: GNAT family N-acetyltransferase [Candidatus Acidoferrum sp.]|nr:GNAT family N-acetyltransferase [Candidatus Acidoferrum sp.]